jgi:ABC-type uncharacterized transport system auxiliary subunit
MSANPRRHTLAILGAVLAVQFAGCAIGPKSQTPPATWDFGPPAAQAAPLKLKALAAVEVLAPRWIDTTNAWYRLAYATPAQPMAYTQTRWVMAPPVLLEVRLRERLVAGGTVLGGNGPLLRVELDEFTQVFESEKSSRAVVRVRATLLAGREVLRQRQFVVEEAAATPDGPGGVGALARAGDRLVETLLEWAGGG